MEVLFRHYPWLWNEVRLTDSKSLEVIRELDAFDFDARGHRLSDWTHLHVLRNSNFKSLKLALDDSPLADAFSSIVETAHRLENCELEFDLSQSIRLSSWNSPELLAEASYSLVRRACELRSLKRLVVRGWSLETPKFLIDALRRRTRLGAPKLIELVLRSTHHRDYYLYTTPWASVLERIPRAAVWKVTIETRFVPNCLPGRYSGLQVELKLLRTRLHQGFERGLSNEKNKRQWLSRTTARGWFDRGAKLPVKMVEISEMVRWEKIACLLPPPGCVAPNMFLFDTLDHSLVRRISPSVFENLVELTLCRVESFEGARISLPNLLYLHVEFGGLPPELIEAANRLILLRIREMFRLSLQTSQAIARLPELETLILGFNHSLESERLSTLGSSRSVRFLFAEISQNGPICSRDWFPELIFVGVAYFARDDPRINAWIEFGRFRGIPVAVSPKWQLPNSTQAMVYSTTKEKAQEGIPNENGFVFCSNPHRKDVLGDISWKPKPRRRTIPTLFRICASKLPVELENDDPIFEEFQAARLEHLRSI